MDVGRMQVTEYQTHPKGIQPGSRVQHGDQGQVFGSYQWHGALLLVGSQGFGRISIP